MKMMERYWCVRGRRRERCELFGQRVIRYLFAVSALVASPALRLCPEYLEASSPTLAARRFTTSATVHADSRPC